MFDQLVMQLVYTGSLLIITLRFTCGERKIHSTIKKSQNIMSMIIGSKFLLQEIILIFWSKFRKKGFFLSQAEKINITTEFLIFELVKVPDFTLN